jgi:hypothetical protein
MTQWHVLCVVKVHKMNAQWGDSAASFPVCLFSLTAMSMKFGVGEPMLNYDVLCGDSFTKCRENNSDSAGICSVIRLSAADLR